MGLLLLFEHASGYAVFKVLGADVVSETVQSSVSDFAQFSQLVNLIAFQPFKTAANALDNINNVSEGIMHEDLRGFLEANLPAKKKSKTTVGVEDSRLAGAIQEQLGVTGQSFGIVLELMRGIRTHFHKFVSGLSVSAAAKAQLGLGHSYSRSKVKFNVNRVDNMIIQSISLMDQLDKDVNTFSMRIREWYSYHFPELAKIVTDNYTYAKVAQYVKSRKDLNEEMVEGLEEILADSSQAQAIMDAARMSMGMDISPIDLINIQQFAVRVIALSEYRSQLSQYLISKMTQVAPNLTALIGEHVGARLISHAGSLTNLAKYPASTVQILGAEKALFRALKTRGNTPKYGLIFHSTFIGRAGAKNKGRVSRYLANKCSIASRIDCFSDQPTSLFGEKLKEQVEERLQFYESGKTPRTNASVMQEAVTELRQLQEAVTPSSEKKKKKKKRKSLVEAED